MPIGPFTTYAPPGVYTRTIQEPVVGQILGGLRIPVIIGVAQETLTQSNFELIRGSSSSADTPIFGEDVSSRWVIGGSANNPTLGAQDGSRTQFKVKNFPIVNGEGTGTVTYDGSKVSVYINGVQTVVAAVDGANGLVSLLTAPAPTDNVYINYYFRRTDTRITDTVTDQITDGFAVLTTPKVETYEIVSGTNDVLELYLNDATAVSTITLTAGTRTAADIANDINAAAISGLSATVHVDNQGLQHVRLTAANNILIGSGTSNSALGFDPGTYTNRNRNFRVFQGPIVDGSDGGITTTDTSKVVVLVNGIQVIPASVDGANRLVTLSQAPSDGSSVTIQYYFNTFQDTFDYLPNSNIVTVGNVGISPDRRDFLNGPDFIVVNDNDQSKILWGTAFQVVSGQTLGSVPFDSKQVIGTLVDNRIYATETTRYTDPTTNVVSTTKFTLPLKPTTGNGRDTPLGLSLFNSISNGRQDLPTNRPDLITVYVGKDVRDALAKPAVEVLQVDSSDNTFVLKDPVPADLKAFATFYYNTIQDDTYTLSVVTPGPTGVGKFNVTSQVNNGAFVYQTRFGTKTSLPQTVQWPSGVQNVPDAFHYGGTPVSETVTVTFNSALLPATHASFVNDNPGPYDLYTASGTFGGVVIDGAAAVSVNLSTAFEAQLLSDPIATPTALSFDTADRLVLEIDGIILAPVDISGAANLAAVVTAINAVIDADTQTHADGSGTFASTAPNTLASQIAYGTEAILVVAGRNTLSATNGLSSNVKVRTPTTVGLVDASAKLGLSPNQESLGSWNALNKPAELVPTLTGTYNITASVNDLFLFNIDGTDYNAVLPSGSAVTTAQVIDYINAGYIATAGSTDVATALASAITLANEFKVDFNNHISDTGAGSPYHALTDAVNTISAANATDLATLITLVNEAKTDYNAHISNTGGVFHTAADTVNSVSTAAATDLATAIRLIVDLKTAYEAHRVLASAHPTPDTDNAVAATMAQFVAITGAGLTAGKFWLRSRVNDVSSRVAISTLGTANTVLGFTSGDSASRTQPTAGILAAALNSAAAFSALGAAYAVQVSGLGTYLQIDSLTSGLTSTISFTSVSNTSFTEDTGIGITPGVSGDTGEAAQAGFSVTSSNPNGSSGTGVPGQTYTDATTGLRFTVLPADAGDYATSGSFTLIVDSTWTADSAIPSKGIFGLETTVYNTIGMTAGTTALLTTYARTGNEPSIGDPYFISYQYAKSDLSTALFRDLRKIQQNFGPPTPEYPLSLAARLALLNGAVIVGLKQVLRASGSSQASAASFISAIDEQRKPISGNVKPDIIVPLGTDPTIYSALKVHCVFMSSPRQEGERIGVVGTAAGTTPTGVQAIARSIQSELIVVVYPDTYTISIQDEFGNSFDQAIDGSFMAAALAGTSVNPSIDVATPWTRRQVYGFKNLGRVLDPTEANQVAVSGVSVIEQVDSGMRVRHGLTTRMDSVITRTPSVTLIIQYVQQSIRRVLDPFIGQKFTGSLVKSSDNALTGMFSTLLDQQIVAGVGAVSTEVDEEDPTIMRASSVYAPIFPLEYITSTQQIRIRI